MGIGDVTGKGVQPQGDGDTAKTDKSPTEGKDLARKYVAINKEMNVVQATTDKKASASLSEIREYLNGDTQGVISRDNLEFIRDATLEKKAIRELKQKDAGKLQKFGGMIKKIFQKIKNRGKSNVQLEDEIIENAERKILDLVKANEDKLNELKSIRDGIKHYEGQKENLRSDDQVERDAIDEDIGKLKERESQLVKELENDEELKRASEDLRVDSSDDSHVSSAEDQVRSENKETIELTGSPIKVKLSDKKVKFNDKADLRVVNVNSNEKADMVIPTVYTDRQPKPEDVDLFMRAEEDISVKEYVETEFESVEKPKGMFESLLAQEEIGYDQACDALVSGLLFVGNSYLKEEESEWISGQMYDLLQDLPNDEVKTLDDLRDALINKVSEKNIYTEELTREDFEVLTSVTRRGLPMELENSQNAMDAYNSLKDGTWKDGEEKEVTFQHLTERKLEFSKLVITELFTYPDVQGVFQTFLTEPSS